MDLDALKQSWNEYDRKLDASLRLNRKLLRDIGLNKVETALQRKSRSIAVELGVNTVILILLGMFIAEHITELRFLAPALVLHLFAILDTSVLVRQLIMLRSIDYESPVVAIQKQVELVRIQRLKTTKWILILSPLLWTPLLVVSMKGLFEVDAYAVLSMTWLALNLLFGLAFIPLMIWVARRYADRMQRSPVLQGLMNDIAGRNLNAAMHFLHTVTRFEADEPAP
ncbi:MAG: hypothetical protein MI924_30280 [Chloroflexales bacterium]|nr:hypothetical protein [Chloroflexales bacterium]